MKIVCLERATLAPEIHIRRPSFAHDWIDFDRTIPAQVAERLAGAAIAVVNKVRVGEEALAALPELKLIAVVGSSRVDLQACKLEYSIVSPK